MAVRDHGRGDHPGHGGGRRGRRDHGQQPPARPEQAAADAQPAAGQAERRGAAIGDRARGGHRRVAQAVWDVVDLTVPALTPMAAAMSGSASPR